MFCRNCGKEIDKNAYVCIHCGALVNEEKVHNDCYNESKTGIGVICAIFLGLVGLIIGYCCFPEDSKDRETFFSGYWTAFAICIAVAIMFAVIFIAIKYVLYNLW